MVYGNKIESIKMLMKESAWAAKTGHEILFKNNNNVNNRLNEIIAAAHINKAISLMNAAKAIYINDYESLAHADIESIFTEFSFFESEFLENLETYHSHQWTDIHFQRFKDAYEVLFGEL